MKLSLKELSLLVLIAVLSIFSWYKFEYHRYNFVDLSLDRKKALARAGSYLGSLGLPHGGYSKAIVFTTDSLADIYLQKTIGPQEEESFLKRYNFELFYWKVRFFKQFQKEEFVVWVSAKSGEILGFNHIIRDTDSRPDTSKEASRSIAEQFLKNNYGLDFEKYEFREEKARRYEHRTEHSFSWQKKSVSIPWQSGKGSAKLVIAATVTGNEIKDFSKSSLDIPEDFLRYLEKQLINSDYLHSLSYFLSLILLFFAVFVILKRRNALVFRVCKSTFIILAVFLSVINFTSVFNNIQEMIMSFPTSTALGSFLALNLVKFVMGLILLGAFFVLPGIAGESMRQEVLPENKYSSFIYYIKTTFYSRAVSRSILLGYVLFAIMLGFQAQIFHLGQKYFGVWREWHKLSQFSSAYLPFWSVFIIGINAAFCEEVTYRVFGISFAKRFLKSTALSVVLLSLVWGLGHSGYSISPFWFRTLEVGLLGLLLGFAFLRYGIITVITAHYLLDVFLGSSVYLLGRSTPLMFLGSLFVCFIPLLIAIIIYCINREERQKDSYVLLDANQRYNIEILKIFISHQKSLGMNLGSIKEELVSRGWDAELIELAAERIQ